MEKKGKELEKIIKLIEETLKDSANTIIYNNHKIKNVGERYREFDVFIESKISGHEIKIAIECKDFKNKIPAEKIEAFETKCKRVPSINKKIFVSSNGFQAEAINVAKDCGIELQIASKLSSNQILNWFPITKLNIQLLSGGSAEIHLEVKEDYFKTNSTGINGKLIKLDKEININDYVVEYYNENRHLINQFAHLQWMKLKEENQKDPFLLHCKFEVNNLDYVDESSKRIKVLGISSIFNMKFEHTLVQPIESISLSDINGNHKADTITVNLDDGATGTFVRTPDNKTTLYLNDPDGSLTHLKLLATYDPKTNIFKNSTKD